MKYAISQGVQGKKLFAVIRLDKPSWNSYITVKLGIG
jgi:hypothetical protein